MSVSASARQPLVMVVEDVHWIDRASEGYLVSFAERLAGSRILLLLTYRSAERPSLIGAGLATQIALPPLTADETAGIARSVFGAGVDEEAVRLVAARAGGNPLFAEELTLAVAESAAAGTPAVLPAAGAASALPATLQGLLTSRLERLGSSKAVAQMAATIGHAFSLPMLEAVAETDPATLAEALDRLAEAEVIVPEGSAGVDYRFRHALIRDAVYQSQGPAPRHQAHARVARALEVTFPEQAAAHPELVALHLTEAGQERAAIAWWVRGGTRARQRAAYAGAIEQLRRGLDLLPAALPPGADRDRIELEVKVSLGISLQATLGFAAPEVGEIHARARELCRTVEGGPLLLGALGGLFLYYLYRSDFRSAREMAEQHLQVTEIIGARNRLCASYSALGYTAFQVGAPMEARAHFERSIELIDTYPRPEGTGLTPNNIGVASESMLALTLCLLGHREAAAVASDGALARAERCPPGERAFSTGYALTCASRLRLMMGEPLEARRCAQEAMRIGREHGFAVHVGAGALADCAARIALGEGAADELAQALAAWRRRGLDLDAPYWLAAIAAGRRAAGRLDDARAMLDEAIAQMERHGERVHESELYRLRGELTAERGGADAEAALPDLERALGVARAQGARLLERRAAVSLHRVLSALGRPAASPLAESAANGRTSP
jgi:tetratricopeptide (TPR) repeat protein